MQNRYLIQSILRIARPIYSIRAQSNQKLNLEKLDAEDAVELEGVDEEAQLREERIEKSRNKSRLWSQHRNMMHGELPFPEPKHWTHGTVRYQRKQFARYGENGNFDPALCWPSKEELALRREYEGIAHPYTIQEMIAMAKEKRDAKNEKVKQRMESIEAKMLKLETWKKELTQRIEKKEADAYAAKERKERLIEEVRRHFGYTVDPRDDRFKEMLEKKEKEQRKAAKEARKKAKEEKMVDKLTAKGIEAAKAEKKPQEKDTKDED